MNLVALIILIGIIALPVATIPLVKAQAGQVTINPTADTYVDFVDQNSNYGNQTYLSIAKFDSPLIEERRIWLKFNLTSIPDGAIVDNATLRLYCYRADTAYNVYARSSSDVSWTELTLTWSNMPSYNATSMDMEQVATPNRWYNWSVTYAVQRAIDVTHGGSDIVTIVLQETTVRSYSWVSFYSKEGYSNYPELTVHWGDVVPEFPSFLILPLLVLATLAVAFYKRKTERATKPVSDYAICPHE